MGGSAFSALACTVVLTIYNIAAHDGQSLDFLSAMGWFLILTFLANLSVACTIGMLWHSIAQKAGWISIHAYWPPAVLVGMLPASFLFAPRYLSGDLEGGAAIMNWLRGFITMMALGGALGGLTGTFAWLIRRPDRDAPNPPTSQP